MGSGCSQHKDIDDPDSEGYNSYRKIKKVVSRKRHSLAVSNNNDGLDASVRFVKLKNSAGTRPDHDPMIDNKDAPRDSFTEKNPFEVRASNVHQIPSDNTKPPLFGEHSTIDEITLGRKLGSGTYGTVYSAHFTGMNGFLSEKTIAAKVLKVPHEQSECERLLIDFENEIKILARVQHPRILLYLGSINQPGDYIIMTELLAGNVCQVLKKTKDTGHSISWDIATQIMLDVSEAMEFLHSRNPPIIHRDLKSENVLLTQDWRAKVADLGLSREIISNKAGNYTVCGTPCWVAPEIFRGEDYGWQVDVYSFAIVVWEILAGEKPFRGVSLLDLPDLVARRCQRPDILLIKVLPRDLTLLMAAMWANNPATRPNFCRIQLALHRIRMQIPDLEKALQHRTKSKGNSSRKANTTNVDGSPQRESFSDNDSLPTIQKNQNTELTGTHGDYPFNAEVKFLYKSHAVIPKSTKRKISGASTAFGGNVPGGVGSRNSGLNHLTLDDQRMVHGHFTTEADGSLSMARGSNVDESFGRAKDSFSMRPSNSKTFPRDSFQSNISSLQTFSSNQSRSNSLDGFGGPEIKMLGEGGGDP